jgi:RNA polymerase sigma factor (sigma-70 family)
MDFCGKEDRERTATLDPVGHPSVQRVIIASSPQTFASPALASDNIRLAFHVAKKYTGRARALGVCREDLQQEAVVALLRASRCFSPTAGTTFSYYACVVIRNHLHNVLAKRQALPARGGAADGDDAAPEQEDPRAEAPDAAAIRTDDKAQVARLLRLLPSRQRQVVSLRFGLSGGARRTFEEIAGGMNVSAERVRQLVAAALTRMRRALDEDGPGAPAPSSPGQKERTS